MNKLFEVDAVERDLSNEWYTPAKYVNAAREVMGGIDLDPASCEMANRTVQATRYYTQAENGLMQDWYGRVWLNPPYGTTGIDQGHAHSGKAYIRLFLNKLLVSWHDQSIEQATMLCRADPTAAWFPPLWSFPICFVPGDICFIAPGNKIARHSFGSCFIYLGPNEARFIDVFSQFGRIVRAVDQPRTKPIQAGLWDGKTALKAQQ